MKTTAVLWFSLFCFGINLQQGFGTTEDNIRYYTLREFEGNILKKFVNCDDHMRKTLILGQKINGISTTKIEVFPFIISDFYEYVEVGDSLVKEEGDLFATVYRGGKKTRLFILSLRTTRRERFFLKSDFQ